MKKILLMGAAVCAVFMMSSCKSKESAYKKAYEKAKQQEVAQPKPAPAVEEVAPVVSAPVQTTAPAPVATPPQGVPAAPDSNLRPLQISTCGEWPRGQVGLALVQLLARVQLPGCTLGHSQLGVRLLPS